MSLSRRSLMQTAVLGSVAALAGAAGSAQAKIKKPLPAQKVSEKRRVLIQSSSHYHTSGYLDFAGEQYEQLYGSTKYEILFIPYAKVAGTYDGYEKQVQDAFKPFGHKIVSIHRFKDPQKAVREASAIAVGGGIPWLTNLEKAARTNHISRVWGILNGTTNYIMDAMHGSDVDFADVLAQAQALGYAEADPSADIDGLDIQRKLILSANVAFGVSLREADVPVFGIRNVRKADIARFQAHGCTCKLIAAAEQKGGSIRACVEPTLLSHDALEAAVPANFNLISMEGDRMGVQSFFGQGAGRYPTAYNVVQDLVDIRRGVHAFYTDSFVPAVPDNSGVQHRYYVRTRAALPELAALAEGDWDGAVITQPVPVSRMHALMAQALVQDGESFFAALQ